jgi:hypothetical protein
MANTLRFHTQGHATTASAGESGPSSQKRAVIEVQATADGVPVDDLAPIGFVGNETSVIALPSGWTLSTHLVGPGGCEMVPILFSHVSAGGGYYSISVIPSMTIPGCVWKSGTYSYVVQYSDGKRVGTALGSLRIP